MSNCKNGFLYWEFLFLFYSFFYSVFLPWNHYHIWYKSNSKIPSKAFSVLDLLLHISEEWEDFKRCFVQRMQNITATVCVFVGWGTHSLARSCWVWCEIVWIVNHILWWHIKYRTGKRSISKRIKLSIRTSDYIHSNILKYTTLILIMCVCNNTVHALDVKLLIIILILTIAQIATSV